MSAQGTAALSPYNVSLASVSPLFVYQPVRNIAPDKGWNALYTGSSNPEDHPPAGVDFRRTQAGGAYINVTFEGTGLYFCISAGGATYNLTVDGDNVRDSAPSSSDSACDHAQGHADTLLYARGLAYGPHSVLLDVTTASAEREFRFFGGTLEIGVHTGGKAVNDSMVVDDLSPNGWTLVPGRGENMWDTQTDEHFVQHSATFNCIYNDRYTATYTFSGAGGAVLLGGIRTESHGFSVQLDDAPPVDLDATTGWFAGSSPFFLTGALDPAVEHRITVRNFNTAMPTCTFTTSCCVSIDAVRLLRAAGDDLPTVQQQDPGSGKNPEGPARGGTTNAAPRQAQKANAGVIAGGVGGGVLALMLVALLGFFLLRRHRRRLPLASINQATGAGRDAPLNPYPLTSQPSARTTGNHSKIFGLLSPKSQSVMQGQSVEMASAQSGRESNAGSAPSRLGREDLEQVLAFVARRMDSSARGASSSREGHGTLPGYCG